MLQGLEALEVNPLRSAPVLLFYCAIVMAFGLIWTIIGAIRKHSFIQNTEERDIDLVDPN